MGTVARSWRIASWLITRAGDVSSVVDALDHDDLDAVALQSVGESDARRIAEDLDLYWAWELSHHPSSRLIPGSGVGSVVMTPHRLSRSSSVVTSEHPSRWSKQRRIAQFATVERHDHSGYTIGHAVAVTDPDPGLDPVFPMVWFRPMQVGVDDARAVELPAGATVVRTETTEPVEGLAPLFTVTFELPWVTGDFPVG